MIKPWRQKMWCIPPDQDAALVAQMEQVPQVYARPPTRVPASMTAADPLDQLLEVPGPSLTAIASMRSTA